MNAIINIIEEATNFLKPTRYDLEDLDEKGRKIYLHDLNSHMTEFTVTMQEMLNVMKENHAAFISDVDVPKIRTTYLLTHLEMHYYLHRGCFLKMLKYVSVRGLTFPTQS